MNGAASGNEAARSSWAAFMMAGISCFFRETMPGRRKAPFSGFVPNATEISFSLSCP